MSRVRASFLHVSSLQQLLTSTCWAFLGFKAG